MDANVEICFHFFLVLVHELYAQNRNNKFCSNKRHIILEINKSWWLCHNYFELEITHLWHLLEYYISNAFKLLKVSSFFRIILFLFQCKTTKNNISCRKMLGLPIRTVYFLYAFIKLFYQFEESNWINSEWKTLYEF